MDSFFRKRKIVDRSPVLARLRTAGPKTTWKKMFTYGLIVFLALVIFKQTFSASTNVVQKVIFSFGSELEKDTRGNTNLLLIGVGGVAHEGPDLTDTLIVASINHQKNAVTMISIPRDLHVTSSIGSARINEIFLYAKSKIVDEKERIRPLIQAVEDATGLPMHYFMKVDFAAFEGVIDALGGIEVMVDEAIYDPYYPKEGTIAYETFSIAAGLQPMDGATALKYVRSRKTTSDFSRSLRQQKVIFAVKEKMREQNLLGSAGRLKDLYDEFQEHVITDLEMRDLIALAEIASDTHASGLRRLVIHDDPSQCGGFLYTPDRNLYGGAFVLVPAGGLYEPIHRLTHLISQFPEFFEPGAEPKLQVLNGTKRPYFAAITKVLLQRHCFSVVRFGNARAQNIPATTYYVKTERGKKLVPILQPFIAGAVSDIVPPEYLQPIYASEADVILELGQDVTKNPWKDPFDQIVELKKNEAKEETAEKEEAAKTENPKVE